MPAKKNTWCFFFPLKGIEIKGKTPEIASPIFLDTTIIPRSEILNIVSEAMKNKKESSLKALKEVTEYSFIREQSEPYDSCIAVKRTFNQKPNPTRKDFDKLKELAKRRAYEISAFLSILFLQESKNGDTCGLVEQIPRKMKNILGINLSSDGFFMTGGTAGFSRIIFSPNLNIKISQNELRKKLNKNMFKNFSEAFLSQKQAMPNSIRNAIIQSSIRLSDAIHSYSLSNQLLGAVTSIEILLSYQVESFSLLTQRTKTLVGKRYNDIFDIESVFKARHLFVHRGQEINSHQIASKSIGLAIACLLFYSNHAKQFPDKTRLIDYLDFLSKGSKLISFFTPSEFKNYKSLFKNKGFRYSTPAWLKNH